jgi:DNA repair exonuclease SbcCD ATPase subunit
MIIDDVSHCSQGEESFISIALSFALIEQSIKKYNIMLLDEIDATLDSTNRALFLNILEDYLDMINSEQVFMVSHNNMFDNYPVDVIMTSDYMIDNYRNVNVIYRG